MKTREELFTNIKANLSEMYSGGVRYFVVIRNKSNNHFALKAENYNEAVALADEWTSRTFMGAEEADCYAINNSGNKLSVTSVLYSKIRNENEKLGKVNEI